MAIHQWAVVTGASSGVGQCFATTLAARGVNVLAVARRKDRLDQLAKTAAAGGATIEPFVADLSATEGLSAVMRRISELHDIEMLVNCAGLATAGDFLDSSLEAELASIRLNVETVVSLTREVLPRMVQRRRGQILNVASVVGFQPFPHFATYAATKAFVLSFTEAIAEEVRGTGVVVLALCPGAIRTELDIFSKNAGLLGKFPSLTAEEVVAAGLSALKHRRVVKIVGLLSVQLALLDRILPRFVARRVMKPMVRVPAVSRKPGGSLVAPLSGSSTPALRGEAGQPGADRRS